MQIQIKYKAFGNATTASLEIYFAQAVSDKSMLEAIYAATNLQDEVADFGYSKGVLQLWKKIEPALDPNRTHTSLSIGDEVTLNNDGIEKTYRCETSGWLEVTPDLQKTL
jgi:hypothetical protein